MKNDGRRAGRGSRARCGPGLHHAERALHIGRRSGGQARVHANRGKQVWVPLKFDLGEAFQFDWSEEGLVVGGIYHRMQVSHMKLCASRAFWLVAYPSQGHEMLFDAHTRSFAA